MTRLSTACQAIIPPAVMLLLLLGIPHFIHAQITTNNALPVGKDKGIVRIQHKIIRATGDPSGADRKLTVHALPLVGVYGISSRLSLFGVLPFLEKNITLNREQQRIERGGGFGLGDMRLFSRYDLYRKSSMGKIKSLAVFGGAELPTGSTDQRDRFGDIPPPLQRGSGSWDPLGGIVFTYQTLDWFFNATGSFQINTAEDSFEFGNEFRLDGVIKYRLFPGEFRQGVPGFFYVLLESNLVELGKNTMDDLPDNNSGGTTWFMDPGVQYITRKFVFEAAVQLPVIEDLNGDALKNDFVTTVSIRINI